MRSGPNYCGDVERQSPVAIKTFPRAGHPLVTRVRGTNNTNSRGAYNLTLAP